APIWRLHSCEKFKSSSNVSTARIFWKALRPSSKRENLNSKAVDYENFRVHLTHPAARFERLQSKSGGRQFRRTARRFAQARRRPRCAPARHGRRRIRGEENTALC